MDTGPPVTGEGLRGYDFMGVGAEPHPLGWPLGTAGPSGPSRPTLETIGPEGHLVKFEGLTIVN